MMDTNRHRVSSRQIEKPCSPGPEHGQEVVHGSRPWLSSSFRNVAAVQTDVLDASSAVWCWFMGWRVAWTASKQQRLARALRRDDRVRVRVPARGRRGGHGRRRGSGRDRQRRRRVRRAEGHTRPDRQLPRHRRHHTPKHPPPPRPAPPRRSESCPQARPAPRVRPSSSSPAEPSVRDPPQARSRSSSPTAPRCPRAVCGGCRRAAGTLRRPAGPRRLAAR